MMTPALDAAGVRRLIQTCSSTHNVRVQIQILNWDHDYLGDASNYLIDGQINFSSRSEVTRTGTISLWDPGYDLGLDSPNPTLGALYYFRMIRVVYSVWRFGDKKSVDIPIFCGPISDLSREGGQLDLTVAGKEWIFGNIWKPLNFSKGGNRRNAIAHMMRERGGEVRFAFETHGAKFGSKVTYPRETEIWPESQRLARSINRQLFYDGRGTARLRSYPAQPSFTFRDGPGGSLTGLPKFGFSDTQRQNVVWLVGGKPKGSKRTTSYVSTLPRSNALSHANLARRVGDKRVPTVYLEKLQDSKVTRKSDAKARTDRSLNSFRTQQLNISYPALVMPFLEEADLTQLTLQGEYSLQVRMENFSIPLIGPSANYGSNRNLALKKRR